jgi:LysR family transcriptional regulator, low CO2-responsive transcriptional regulator
MDMSALWIAMNLNQLRVFYLVAREKGFTRAARLLNITQPAASLSVREFERDSGAQLFERIGKRVFLTDAGQTLFGYARQIFDLAAEADHALANARDLRSGQLRIGAGQTTIEFISPTLHRFKRSYPGVKLSATLGNSQRVLADVLDLRVDAGTLAGPPSDRRLASLPCVREPLVIVVPSRHAWAKRKTLSLKALQGEPLILREPGSGTRALVESALRDVGAEPEIVMELPMNVAIKSAVEAGIGVAIMLVSVVRQDISAGRLAAVRIQGHQPVMKLDWIFLESRARSRILRALLETIKKS